MFNINNKNLISLALGLLFVFTLLPISASAYYYVGWEGNNYVGYSKDIGSTGGSNYNDLNPIPVVNSISPNSARVNQDTTITVTGHNFVQGSIVKWNDSNKSTTFVNSTTLRARLDYYDLNSKGNYLVTVFNPTPGGGYSNAATFIVNSYVAPNTNNNTNNTTKNYTTTTTKKTTNNTNNTTATTDQTNDTTSSNTNDGSQVKELAAGAIFGYNAFLPSSIFQWIFFFILILLAVILWRKLYITESDKHAPLKHA